MADRMRVRVGPLAFGLAFVAVGAVWLAGGRDLEAAWLAVVAAIALGAAAVVTAVAAIVRTRA